MTLSPSHAVQCGLEDQPGKEDTTRITVAVLMVRRVNILTDLLDIVQNPGCKGAQGRMRMLPGLRRPELTKKIKYLLLVSDLEIPGKANPHGCNPGAKPGVSKTQVARKIVFCVFQETFISGKIKKNT